MALGVLVLGESGSGKTFSISGFSPEEVKILSVHKPILPFRGKYEIVRTPTAKDVIRELHNTTKKNIVIDDFQYILGLSMMDRLGEKGWEKFNEIQQPYADVLKEVSNLPDDVIIYYTSHVERDDSGRTKIKTVGKALDKYITVEGLFMIVLQTAVIDSHYYFTTQNNGNNTVKSPYGMFTDMYIPNNLHYVEEKIRNYYYMDGAKSDEEMAKTDEEVKVIQPEKKSRRRTTKKVDTMEDAENDAMNTFTPDEPLPTTEPNTGEVNDVPKRTRRKRG